LEVEVMLKLRTLIFGTIVLALLLQIRLGYSTGLLPEIPEGFVKIMGPHGKSVLIGPLQASPTGGYEREVILPGRAPFMISTEPGVTPQEIANTYG
jgi:hypothetical protein